MTYIKLIIDFFIVGLLSFGGAYSAIPLIKEVASHYEIITEDLLVDFIAISESTPGPVAVNLATFVGSYVGGIPGAIFATFAEVLPAFIIILVFTLFFKGLLKNDKVSYALSIIRPCIIGIITSAGVCMVFSIVKTAIINAVVGFRELYYVTVTEFKSESGEIYKKYLDIICSEFSSIIIVILLVIIVLLYSGFAKKKMSAIKIIIVGAVLGIAINYLL